MLEYDLSAMKSWIPYLRIARPDHWFKNVFMVPGILLAFFFQPDLWGTTAWWGAILGVLATCGVASANYVLNEILDAPSDRFHPDKQQRPIPSGQVKIPLAWLSWIGWSGVSLLLAFLINLPFGAMALGLWIMGGLYNVPPIRLKDRIYGDVLSESVNNPLRLALGWYAVGGALAPPLSVIIAYWMFGAFLMAAKRFAELRQIADPARAARYRKSFGRYTEEKLIVSIFYYATLFALMGGFFIARYHFELIAAAPLVAYTMAYYMHLSHKPNSPVQQPEQLYRQRKLMALVTLSFVACALLLFINLPDLRDWFTPLIEPPN